MDTHEPNPKPDASRPDVMITAARAATGAIAVALLAFGLSKVRSIIILLLLALTFAAAIRPGVEWLHRKRVPEPLAIFFSLGIGVFILFFWLAVPPAVHRSGTHSSSLPAPPRPSPARPASGMTCSCG
jgi:predicted PurR-regulated permease PerM